MKKIKLILALCTILIISIFSVSNGYAKELTNNNKNTWLGKTINVITSEKYSDMAPSGVLDEEYYDNLKYMENKLSKYSKCNYYSGTSATTIRKKFNSDYQIECSLDGAQVYGFTLGANQRFSWEDTSIESTYAERSYLEFIGEVDIASFYIQNVYSKLSDFKNNLSENYLKELDMLANNEITYDQFFGTNGTHLIANYTIGDRLYCESCVATNEILLEESFTQNLYQSISAKYSDISSTVENKSTILNEYNLSEKETHISSASCCASGKVIFNNDGFRINESIEQWIDYVNDSNFESNATIVSYNQNGLIPIWEFLPENSPVSKDSMKSAYIDYARKNGITYDDSNSDYVYGNIIGNKTLRDAETKITDCDRFDNTIDTFSIDTKYGFDLIKSNYKQIDFVITFDVYRTNKGTRYVYLYNQSDINERKYNEYLAYSTDISSKKKKWLDNVTVSFSVPIEQIDSLDFGLVWRASGFWSDKWKNRDIRVSYTLLKK